MSKSPTLCQSYVAAALHPIRQKYYDLYNIHDMVDILLAAKCLEEVHDTFADMQQALVASVLIIAPEKFHAMPPYFHFGHILQKGGIKPQKWLFDCAHLKTLHD